MFDNELFESLKETTKNWASGTEKKPIKETEDSVGNYSENPQGEVDGLAKIVHQMDTYKTQAGWPDNFHSALKGATLKQAAGNLNPGNMGAEQIAVDAQKKDDSQVSAEMGRDVKAVKDEEGFIPESEVKEETVAGNINPGNKAADKETNKELAKDNDTNNKTMSAELKNDANILKKTGPSVGPTKK
jgi:hypothetical protein